MKKHISKKSFFVLALIIGISFGTGSKCFSQGWQFAKSQGGNGDDGGRITTTDPSGNVYVAGTFYSASLPIGTLTPLTNAGVGSSDAFLAKFDANGNALWSQRIGGAQYDDISGITLDPTGQIWVTGSFNSTLISVPPATMGNSNSTGNFYDGYIAVFNSIGSCQGLVAFGGAGDQYATGCVFSGSQNCLYVTGSYATATMTVAPTTLTNTSTSGKYDIFLARFTTAGTVTWAKTTGGINSDDRVSSISVDASGFPYIGGTFSPNLVVGNTVIGTTTLTSLGMQDIFLAKYNTSGTFQWAQGLGSNQGGDYLTDLKIDGANNICVSGYYQLSTMSVSTVTLANSGGYDAFIAKYSSAGAVQWANKIGAAYDEYGYGLDVDGSNNIYLTGAFSSTAVAVGTTTLANTTTTTSYSDAFVTKYNSTGAAQWAVNPHGAYNEVGYDVSSDVLGNIYVVGQFNVAGPTAFGTTTLSSAGLYDSFLAKIGCLTATISGISSVCAGSSTTLTAGGATSYTWNTGATTPSIVISPTASATYSALGATGSCTGASTPYSVTLLPASINMGSNINLLCNQSQAINVTTNPTATLVAWTPTTGLTASNTLSPTISTTAAPAQYSVAATLNNGCAVSGTIALTRYAPKPDICLVSVDSLGLNNEIFWEKTLYANVDSFIVYREVTTNVYKRIAAISNNNFSGYTDTSRSVGPANGDPNFTSYKYKLQIRDVCGNYSALSLWHQTLFIQDQQNGNFNWNSYAIESSGTPVSLYDLYRIDIATNTYSLITSTTANLATDPAYSTWQTTAKWRVQANGFTCNPTPRLASPNVLKIKTKSNIKNDRLVAPAGIRSYDLLNNSINVYPMPASDIVYLNSKRLSNVDFEIELQNALGQIVFTKKYSASSNDTYQLETTSFTNGIYFINVKQQNNIIAAKKIVISK